VGGRQKALGCHACKLLQEWLKKTSCIQNRDGLMVKSKLPLAQKLREFFEGTQAAGARDDTA
jgi:hypothetical protein